MSPDPLEKIYRTYLKKLSRQTFTFAIILQGNDIQTDEFLASKLNNIRTVTTSKPWRLTQIY